MILVYPARPVGLAWLSTLFTTSKYASGVVILALVVVGLVKAVQNRFNYIEGGLR